MRKTIDPALREHAVRLVRDHGSEHSSRATAIAAMARQEGVGAEPLRRWVLQAELDAGVRDGQTSEQHAEIRRLRAEIKRFRDDVVVLKAVTTFFAGNSTPATADHEVRGARGRINRAGPARAGRAGRRAHLPSLEARSSLAPEGLYGRKKMTALIRRSAVPDVSRGGVDRAMRSLSLEGITRAKAIRTTIQAKDGSRAGDFLDRDFTYVRTWAGWVYVAFILDVFSQCIVVWHAQSGKQVDFVMTPLGMALWERDRQGHPVGPDQLIHHPDAGSQCTSIRLTEHLALEGIIPSIGTVGDAYDTALMETINGLYKAECVRTTVFHEGPYNSTRVRTGRSWTSSSRPLDGSTGTTAAGSTVASAWSVPEIMRRPTTRL